jgi:GWxTD domain-containing protein
MPRKMLVSFVLFFVCLAFLLAGNEAKPLPASPSAQGGRADAGLAPAYRHWLDLVAYIASSEELRVFKSLTSDRDRDSFINIFWAQRDPTPGTPQNETRDEIEARFAYANEFLKRGSGRPGWMTDMGRFHMILGKPNSINRYEDKYGLYPVQVWWYYGDAKLGLPTYFGVTFYKRFGAGEWRLYDPARDGPGALLSQETGASSASFDTQYKKVVELAPELADPVKSMIPNDQTDTAYGPPLRNNLILASIYSSPFHQVNATYATNFLKYKGFVNIEQNLNFVENSHLVSLSRDPRLDYDLVTVSVRPRKISIGYNEARSSYFFNLNLSVSLRQGEKTVYQYTKNFDFYTKEEEVAALQASGVVIHDSFPVIPGRYELLVFAENSVGKEFTYFDKVLVAPGNNAVPFLATPLVGFRREPVGDNFFASYRFAGSRLCIDSDSTFGTNEMPVVLVGAYNLPAALWEAGTVEMTLKAVNERAPFSRTRTIKLSEYPRGRDLNALIDVAEAPLRPDYYELTLKLINGAGSVLDTKTGTFTVSPLTAMNHPRETFKQTRSEAPDYFDLALAAQYDSIGELDKAGALYERALQKRPDALDSWVRYLSVANRLHRYDRVLAEAERLQKAERLQLDYRLLRGTAFFGQGKFREALDELLVANRIYNSDIRVLNLLGFTFLKLNDPKQALRVLAASLELNREQPQISQVVAEVKRRAGPAEKK